MIVPSSVTLPEEPPRVIQVSFLLRFSDADGVIPSVSPFVTLLSALMFGAGQGVEAEEGGEGSEGTNRTSVRI